MRLRVPIIVTICVAVAYSLLIATRAQSVPWEWLNTLVATGISFFLALVAGIFLFNKQTEAKRNGSRADLHALLSAELSDMRRILNDTERMAIHFADTKLDVLIAYVQPLVVEKSALSGLFDSVQSENLFNLARKVHMYQIKINYFLGLLQSRANGEYLTHANKNMEETRVAVLRDIDFLANQLGLQLTERYPD